MDDLPDPNKRLAANKVNEIHKPIAPGIEQLPSFGLRFPDAQKLLPHSKQGAPERFIGRVSDRTGESDGADRSHSDST
jgi:hypothetical protein